MATDSINVSINRYNSALRLLFRMNDYKTIYEVASGDVNKSPIVAALGQIKRQGLSYCCIDTRIALDTISLRSLQQYLLRYSFISHSFFDQFVFSLLTNVQSPIIICLEHSIDDLLLDMLAPHVGVVSRDWVALLNKLDGISARLVEDPLVINMLEDILCYISDIMTYNPSAVVIIHQYRNNRKYGFVGAIGELVYRMTRGHFDRMNGADEYEEVGFFWMGRDNISIPLLESDAKRPSPAPAG